MNKTHILIVDDSRLVITRLSALLTRLGYKVTAKQNPISALTWLKIPGNFPNLIISDVMMPEMTGHEFIHHVRADPTTAHLPIILLTANDEISDKVAGFTAGADDYLLKSVSPTELELRVKALLTRRQVSSPTQPRTEAKTITVFSLRGGVGTTSLAVNLSIALAQLWGIQVPLLDLALKNGHCSMMLNVKPNATLTSLAAWEDDSIEVETIENLLLKHKSGVKLLAAPVSPVEAELITPATVDLPWPYLRASYPFLIIDGGSHLVEPVLTVLERTQVILLLLAPELASIKAAIDAMQVFEQLGYDPEHVLPVINCTFPNHGLPQNKIEAALGRQAASVIPYDPNIFVQAINTGQPAMSANPNSPAGQAMAGLAYKLSSAEMEAKEIAKPSHLLTKIRKLAGTV